MISPFFFKDAYLCFTFQAGDTLLSVPSKCKRPHSGLFMDTLNFGYLEIFSLTQNNRFCLCFGAACYLICNRTVWSGFYLPPLSKQTPQCQELQHPPRTLTATSSLAIKELSLWGLSFKGRLRLWHFITTFREFQACDKNRRTGIIHSKKLHRFWQQNRRLLFAKRGNWKFTTETRELVKGKDAAKNRLLFKETTGSPQLTAVSTYGDTVLWTHLIKK